MIIDDSALIVDDSALTLHAAAKKGPSKERFSVDIAHLVNWQNVIIVIPNARFVGKIVFLENWRIDRRVCREGGFASRIEGF